MRQFHFGFYCFFNFLNQFFFLNDLVNPFIVHSRPSFLLESDLHFSLVVFVLSSSILTLTFFCFFYLSFFRNGFPNSLIFRSRSSFLFSQ